jgi:NAD+ synthase (glutamine-hydrolysing)
MRIALAQLDPIVGDIEGNVRAILESASAAKSQGADLVVFPELAITGYPPRDLLNIPAFVRAVDEGLERIVREVPEGLFVILGAPRRRQMSTGRSLVNAAVALVRGSILLEVPKALLPTYDVFDERRYFEPCEPDTPRVISLGGVKVGLTICEDMWNDRLLWEGKRYYDRDPVAEAVEQGATLIVNVSASPFAKGKYETRRKLVGHAARRWGVPVVYVNTIGGQDGLLFDGGSIVCDRDGALVAELPFFEPALRVIELTERAELKQHHPMEQLAAALTLGIRDYAKKTGMSRWALGLSGGIDSALVAALGTLALGADQGATFGLPSRYSSDHSLSDARVLAEKLGVPFRVVPIDPAHRAYEEMLAPVLDPLGPPTAADVTYENIQARARGATLMAYANRTGALLLTTGNKSECAVGYCTLYGDMCGGLAVIADLWKLEVYELSRWLNDHAVGGAIPESTFVKPPSAELRPGQRDDQSLPPYEILDPILRCLVEEEMGVEEAARASGHAVEIVRAMQRKLFLAEYKRKQFAPTLRVSSRSWTGRDYPLAMKWQG